MKRAPREAGATRDTCHFFLVLAQLRARAGDVFKVSSLERLYASPAVCSRREFEDAGPHVLVAMLSLPSLLTWLHDCAVPELAQTSSAAQDRWVEVPGLLGPGFVTGRDFA